MKKENEKLILVDPDIPNSQPMAKEHTTPRERPGKFGDFLVREGYITAEQLQQALNIQKDRFRSLIDVMLELGMISQSDLDELEQELKEKQWGTESDGIRTGGP